MSVNAVSLLNFNFRKILDIQKACKNNELSCVIDIDGFDEFLNLIYKNYEYKNPIIDERWKDFDNRK